TEQAKLAASDPMPNDRFGLSVAVSGETAIVGTQPLDVNRKQGFAYIYTRSGRAWSPAQKLVSLDPSPDELFGYSVAI
ncbi:hypothetical protein FQ011_26135, partial [Escherichia coli]|uniref:FG-GAP repeat protein n=1 Tax=Escherichia coli TaxID=562 RepID=UPI001328BC67